MKTIHELPFERFEVARAILSDPPADRAYIEAGLTGINPARVFVDDPERPTAALMCRTYEFFVGGVLGTAIDDFMRDAPAEAEVWSDFYGFVAVDPEWNDHLRALQPGLEVEERRSFRFDPARIDTVRGAANRVPRRLRLVSLTPELAEIVDHELNETIGFFWGGYVRFARHGFGAAILDGERSVAVTFTATVGGGDANLGVMTHPDYRRRGLATLTSQAAIEMAHERGLVATWDCDLLNVPSGLLAESLGFTEQPPFQELGFLIRDPTRPGPPGRGKPEQSRGRWIRENLGNGGTRYSRLSRRAPECGRR
jgi:GNAT superfamily N-acetyltransferase